MGVRELFRLEIRCRLSDAWHFLCPPPSRAPPFPLPAQEPELHGLPAQWWNLRASVLILDPGVENGLNP